MIDFLVIPAVNEVLVFPLVFTAYFANWDALANLYNEFCSELSMIDFGYFNYFSVSFMSWNFLN